MAAAVRCACAVAKSLGVWRNGRRVRCEGLDCERRSGDCRRCCSGGTVSEARERGRLQLSVNNEGVRPGPSGGAGGGSGAQKFVH